MPFGECRLARETPSSSLSLGPNPIRQATLDPASSSHAVWSHPSGILLTVLQISWVGAKSSVLASQAPPAGTGSVSHHGRKHVSELFKGPCEPPPGTRLGLVRR